LHIDDDYDDKEEDDFCQSFRPSWKIYILFQRDIG